MATIQEFLAEQGLTAEEVTALVGNEKQAKAMEAALRKHNEGIEAQLRAEAKEKETQEYWAGKTTELQNGVNRLTAAEKRAAKAEAEAAQRTAYLKSLKAQGYDVPDEVVGEVTPPVTTTTAPDPSKFLTRDDWEQQSRKIAPDLVTLTSLSNEYQYLTGQPYVDINTDFEEARKNGKPLTEFVRAKYDFAGKKAAMAQKSDQERIDKIVSERLAAEEKKWQEAHGSNPNTKSPMPSMFDRLQKNANADGKTVLSAEAREKNKLSRKERFANMSTHVN